MRHGVRIAAMGGGVRLVALVLAAGLTATSGMAGAQGPSERFRLLQRVVLKHRDFKLLNGQDPARDSMLTCHCVLEVKGPSLLIMTSRDPVWIPADQVVPIDGAVAFFTDAIRANPRDPFHYLMRAKVLLDESDAADKALADFDEAIRLAPRDAAGYRGRAEVWSIKRDWDKAIADCGEAIRLDPKDAESYLRRSESWGAKQDLGKALADANEAIRPDPRNEFAFDLRGTIFMNRHEYDRSIADYKVAVRLHRREDHGSAGRDAPGGENPTIDRAIDNGNRVSGGEIELAGAYAARGADWHHRSEYDKAIADCKEYDKALVEYDRAIQIDPQSKAAYVGRAWIQATAADARYRDGRKAVAAAATACELWGWKNAHALDTMAAASAEAGDFEAAVKWETRAIERQTDREEKAEYAARLALYREKKPYRDAKP